MLKLSRIQIVHKHDKWNRSKNFKARQSADKSPFSRCDAYTTFLSDTVVLARSNGYYLKFECHNQWHKNIIIIPSIHLFIYCRF